MQNNYFSADFHKWPNTLSRGSVRIFLRGYLFVWLQYLVSKEEFLFLNSPRGFWRSLGQRPHFIHLIDFFGFLWHFNQWSQLPKKPLPTSFDLLTMLIYEAQPSILSNWQCCLTLRYGKLVFQGCNNCHICNDPSPGQDKMHPHRGMPKSPLYCHLCIPALCTLGGQRVMVSVVRAAKNFACWFGGINSWSTQHVEGVLNLRGKSIPYCNWKLLSVVASAAMNAALNVLIPRLVALTQWLCGSMTCSVHLFLVRFILIWFVAWLSIMFSFGLNPFAVNSLK